MGRASRTATRNEETTLFFDRRVSTMGGKKASKVPSRHRSEVDVSPAGAHSENQLRGPAPFHTTGQVEIAAPKVHWGARLAARGPGARSCLLRSPIASTHERTRNSERKPTEVDIVHEKKKYAKSSITYTSKHGQTLGRQACKQACRQAGENRANRIHLHL